MKIGIDMDEVVVEFFRYFLDFYNQKSGKNFQYEDWHSYNFWEVFGGTKEEAIGLVEEFYETEFFDNLEFIFGAEKSIKELYKNHNLKIITARPKKLKEKTERFLDKYFSEENIEVIYSKDGYEEHLDKGEICKSRGVELMIEDHKNYALSCTEKGINVLLFDKPWNQNNGADLPKEVIRVRGWGQILVEVNKLNQLNGK